MKTFWIRTASAAVFALLFLGSIYSGRWLNNPNLGLIIFTAFLLFVCCGCTFEFFRMMKMQGARPCRVLGYAYAVGGLLVMCLTNLDCGFVGFKLRVSGITLLPILFGLSAIVQLWYHGEQPFRDAAYTLVPLLYVALPLGLMPQLHIEMNVLVMLILMVWLNDSGAYLGGSLFGKHKIWPVHSPGKTWEGSILGFVATLVLACWVGPLFNEGIALWQWVVLALICSVVDTLGDLVESMLKRSVGVKDSGKIMPGHGGFLDRFDSLLIIVPFAAAFLFFTM